MVIAADGWPDDLTVLPGVGRYTAGAIAAQADDVDVPALDVNVRRVVERVRGAPAHDERGGTRRWSRSGDRCAVVIGCSR